jgi:folate-binding protein YgfZ
VVGTPLGRDASCVRSDATTDDVEALASGRAFVVLHGHARVAVHGADAVAWLHDLLTADVAGLPLNGLRRSFLLTPNGRIRADVWVVRRERSVDLIERAAEPVSITALLGPYVLSSDVSLSGPDPVAIVAFPSIEAVDRVRPVLSSLGLEPSRPSVLGDGMDAIVEAGSVGAMADALRRVAAPATEAAAEALRVRRGIPRWRVDVDTDGFPVATRADDAVAPAKGCFLGQEAVAKIRNLGHPPTVLLHLRAAGGPPEPGTELLAEGRSVGRVTSAGAIPEGAVVLARIRWDAAQRNLALPDGSPLRPAAASAAVVDPLH